MKNTHTTAWGRRALAALLCLAMTLSAPAGMALAEETAGASSAVSAQASSESAAVSGAAGETAETPSETADDNGQSAPTSGAQSVSSAPADAGGGQSEPASSAPAQSAPAASSEQSAPAASSEQSVSDGASQPEAAQPESAPQPAESEPGVQASDAQSASSALPTAWAGQTLTFVDLHWKTAPLAGVEAVFTGDGDAPAATVAMTAGERGLFTAVAPQGDYCRVAFYRAGEAGTGTPLGGVWRLDGQPETAGGASVSAAAADAVAFAAGGMSAFYYDSGENPSYWGPVPDYDPASQPALYAADGAAERSAAPGDQLYFVNLHALQGDETDPIVTVEARFIEWPHGTFDEMVEKGQFLGRTMYEVRDGVYVAPFPKEINTQKADGTYLYQEVAFDLTRRSGDKDEFNRHYNFRGVQNSDPMEGTWGTPGWFTYAAGTMDAYYYNTNVADSYWNAHPSDADEGLHSRLLYFDLNDYGLTEEQQLGELYLRWPGMPASYREYTYVDGKGFLMDTWTNTEGILYFQIPADGQGLTENTVFTLTYTIAEGSSHAGTHTFLFTYVPRSGRNTIRLDDLWEDTGEVWSTYEAKPGEGATTRGVYFNNAVAAFGKVQVVVGTQNADGSFDWMTGPEACASDWAHEHVIDPDIGPENWARGWLSMEEQGEAVDGHPLPNNVWGLQDIPDIYTHVMFRCAVDPNAPLSNGDQYWFSPPLAIDTTYSYPCFFAYRYMGAHASSANDNTQLGNTQYLDGAWGSAVERYTLGDASVDVPQKGNFTSQDNVYYANSTYYDYYSLWEQSGRAITESAYAATGENWCGQGVLLNIAASAYFKQADAAGQAASDTQPLYFGAGAPMGNWGGYLRENGLYGSWGVLYDMQALYNFTDHANTWKAGDGARTGLMDTRLNSEDNATMNGVEAPYFSEAFLRGENALEVTLGGVYKNVLFPFHRLEDENSDYDGYWQFDSAKTAVRLTQGTDQGYYLEESSDPLVANFGAKSYLPFNDKDDDASMTSLNYMFGQRLDISFTVPEGGQVNMADPGEEANMRDVIFEFQGDDDCWVFIDGQLVLDMGGIHDPVRGTINFKDGTWNIYRAVDVNKPGSGTLDDNGTFTLTPTADGSHTLTMLYLERGLYASNLKLTFNFPQQNQLRVTKQVDTSGVNEVFSEAMENLGSFEMNLETLASGGSALEVENSAGYIQTETTPLYLPGTGGTGGAQEPADGEATETTAADGTASLQVKQPNGWAEGAAPQTKDLLTLTPDGGSADLTKAAFLELQLYNNTTENRGAQLYIQLQDADGNLCGGTARVLSYLGEANLFLPASEALVRIDLDKLTATAQDAFDLANVTAVRIGLQKGTASGSYGVRSVTACTEWNQVLQTGFSVGDDQISDYGSLAAGDYQPANGAWYTRQTRSDTGAVTESVASVVQDGSFSLGNRQTAVFTDKFRVGSYIRLTEHVDSELFSTVWSLRENGQPVSFNSLLANRTDLVNVQNPDWGFSRGEYPLEEQQGTKPYDGRTELANEAGNEGEAAGGFVYRSYLAPDNNENLPVDLEVVFCNTMRTSGFTITKKLAESMYVEEAERYPVGTYTFDVYYMNIAGRGLEQYLPAQPFVEGCGDHYVHQVITITTDAKTGTGSFTMTGVPAGTVYRISERPANGATLVDVAASDGLVLGKVNGDYTNAWVANGADADETELPTYTFTNENKPFYMQVQKVWQGEPADVDEIRIQLQRRPDGSTDEAAWENVTTDFFGEDITDDAGACIVLTPDEHGNWTAAASQNILPTQGNGQDAAVLYEYRIVELGVGEGELASYRVEYTQERGEEQNRTPTVIYKAVNSPTGLTLQKSWLDNDDRDGHRPDAVRVQLQRSTGYDPEDPTAQGVVWETVDASGAAKEDALIELCAPEWRVSLEGLPASSPDGETYYYRLQEVQVQQTDGNWHPLAEENTYEPAYSLPVTLGQAATLTVENALKTAGIRVLKQDALDANKLLQGAVFRLERLMQAADGSWLTDPDWPAMTGLTTYANGLLEIEGLRPGRYRLTETEAPAGYAAALTPVDVTLGAEHLGAYVTVAVKNSAPLDFTFTKVAAQDHTQTLQGAQFRLYPLACGDASHTHADLLDENAPAACWGNPFEAESGTGGTVLFANLPAGVYRLVETKAPAGYATPAGQWQVTLAADGGVQIEAVGNPPAFLTENGGLQLTNRKPLDMPTSGGPGVPLAAALGTALMGVGTILAVTQLRAPKRGRGRKNGGKRS